jgi:uncharacterized SAM-binding protein YcdF (DUF218 family)
MLENFFLWLGNQPFSKGIGESLWIFPIVQAFHLVFLAILVGAVLIVDLRLLGQGMIKQPVATLARDARPWLIFALIGMVLTGFPQMAQNAAREYYSEYFWQKMYFSGRGADLHLHDQAQGVSGGRRHRIANAEQAGGGRIDGAVGRRHDLGTPDRVVHIAGRGRSSDRPSTRRAIANARWPDP